VKRIIYISNITNPLSIIEIEEIGIISSQSNIKVNLTGLLVYFDEIFYQVIEGEDEDVNRLYLKIKKDPRHKNVLRLKTEYAIKERLFPTWSMKTINLDNNVDDLLRPIKILLQTVIESHSIIKQYTQPTILKLLNEGTNPLLVEPTPIERVILFADIISYSTISENISIEDNLYLVNTYFEVCSRIILSNGGEVNKFMGDGLMAYFDKELTENAIQACLEILKELKELRHNSKDGSALKMLSSGFGLDQGIVIEGNMGSKYKTDYTIIGDTVNTASRLEGLTRKVNRSIVFSDTIKENMKGKWDFVSLGNYNLKGKKNKSAVYTIDNHLVNEFENKI
jgi:adenylate cyclase